MIDVDRLASELGERRALALLPPGLLGYDPLFEPPRGEVDRIAPPAELALCFTEASVNTPALRAALTAAFERGGMRLRTLPPQAEKEADVVAAGWVAEYPDSDGFFYPLLHSEGGYFSTDSPEIDALLEQGRTLLDADARGRTYRELERTLAELCLVLPTYHPTSPTVLVRPEIRGWEDLETTVTGHFDFSELWVG